jgi:hypothetical protein
MTEWRRELGNSKMKENIKRIQVKIKNICTKIKIK